jgi:hypothetical protein
MDETRLRRRGVLHGGVERLQRARLEQAVLFEEREEAAKFTAGDVCGGGGFAAGAAAFLMRRRRRVPFEGFVLDVGVLAPGDVLWLVAGRRFRVEY